MAYYLFIHLNYFIRIIDYKIGINSTSLIYSYETVMTLRVISIFLRLSIGLTFCMVTSDLLWYIRTVGMVGGGFG